MGSLAALLISNPIVAGGAGLALLTIIGLIYRHVYNNGRRAERVKWLKKQQETRSRNDQIIHDANAAGDAAAVDAADLLSNDGHRRD